MNTKAVKIHNTVRRQGIKTISANKKKNVSDRSINPLWYVITFELLSILSLLIIPPTIRNIEIHKTMAAKENKPGQIRLVGSVVTIAIIMETSTSRSQNISNIPPKIVGPSNLAIEPSSVSIKKETVIAIAEHIINDIANAKKILLRYIKNELVKPKNNPRIVS
jgi:hypothetical protein